MSAVEGRERSALVRAWTWGRPSRAPRTVMVVGVALGLVALVGLSARFVAPHRAVLIGVTAFGPYLMLAGPLALSAFVLARGWWGAIAAGLLVAACVLSQSPLWIGSTSHPTGPSLTVMTSNLKLGGADPESVIAAVRRHDVDILALEELTPQEEAALTQAGLEAALPYRFVDARPVAAGVGIWSRYPLTDTALNFSFTFAFVTARVTVPGSSTPIQFVALHMSGSWPAAGNWSRDIAHLPSVLHSLPTSAPVVVAGDFNATTDMQQFRALLSNGYRDAALQSHAGLVPTFPADTWYPPLIAIDHVLTRGASAQSVQSVTITGSDHRALVSTVRLAS